MKIVPIILSIIVLLVSCEESLSPITITNNSSFDVQFKVSAKRGNDEIFSVLRGENITLNFNGHNRIIYSSITPQSVTYSTNGFNVTFSDKEQMSMEIKNITDEKISLTEMRGVMYPSTISIDAKSTNNTTKIYGGGPSFLVSENTYPVRVKTNIAENIMYVLILY